MYDGIGHFSDAEFGILSYITSKFGMKNWAEKFEGGMMKPFRLFRYKFM